MGESESDVAFNVAQWLVDRHVDEGRGDRVAIRCQGRSSTYADVQRSMFAVQRLLESLGVAAGDRVAMVVRDDEHFPAFFLGAQRSGVVPVPLSTMLKGDALGGIVADSGARVVVVSAVFAEAIPAIVSGAPEVAHVVVCGVDDVSAVDVSGGGRGRSGGAGSGGGVSDAGDDGGEATGSVDVHAWAAPDGGAEMSSEPMPLAGTTRNSPAFWLYSSGTTGVPKGVMHVHGNVPATVETYADQVLGIGPDDRFLSVAKLFFAYGLGNALTFPFSQGATTILHPDPPTPPAVLELLETEQPTLFFSSPGFCAALLDASPDPSAFDSVRTTVTAGEALPPNIHTRFTKLTGTPVLDGIGSTELLHIFISNTVDEQVPGSSGRVVPGYEAEIRGDDERVLDGSDMPGYLHVRGGSSAVGYHDRPDATAAAFLDDGWVRTGDVYVRHHRGHLIFLGRDNDMIKAGGIWVSPAEVEAVLVEHESVLEVAVVGARDDEGLETVVAFVVPTSGMTIDPDELDAHCRERIASFKRPRRIEVVEALPRTATGKVKRFELRDSL